MVKSSHLLLVLVLHIGLKTEERAHVLTRPYFFSKVKKAQKKFLCLSTAVFLNCGVHSAQAQNTPVYAQPNSAAQTEIRMQQLEKQIRELTGKVENQRYEINSLNQKIKLLEGKTDVASSKPVTQPTVVKQAETAATGRMGESFENDLPPMPNTDAVNTLGLDFSVQESQGMQTKTVIGGGDADATAQYEKAYADLKLANYDRAQQGFEDFLRAHNDHVLAANAQYWLGESFYVRDDFAQAARAFAQGFQTYPDSAKSPDILLKLGLSLKGLEKTREACVALGQLPVKFLYKR
jgi:tol-pal system protein YbgF